MKRRPNLVGYLTFAAFAVAFAYFQFAYPYHLIRREQLTLFLFDRSYIAQTYSGAGWLARLSADFLCQFFGLSAAGPLITALLLAGIAYLTYRIFRHFAGNGIALTAAVLMFLWSFFRENENLFVTRYTVVTLGYLALVAAALKIRRPLYKVAAAVAFLSFGVWGLGSPYHQYYGKLWGTPNLKYEKMIALDVESSRENWDKVLKLSRKDLRMVEASYLYNLACAKKGALGENLLKHSQSGAGTLFLWVTPEVSPFSNSIAGEVWYHLGDMTLAEQSAMVAMQSSPNHSGTRYIERLAKVNLISGEDGAAQKYLNVLSKTLFYRRWALEMLSEEYDEQTREWIMKYRANLPEKDIVSDGKDIRPILKALVETNPNNTMAKEYLLCYDLMTYDLVSFAEDYTGDVPEGSIYQEARLIYINLINDNDISGVDLEALGISQQTMDRLERFYRAPSRYKNTYWYLYLQATS